jgi:hypothetical protein
MPREIAGFDGISHCDQIAERIGFSLELGTLLYLDRGTGTKQS